MTSTPQPRRCSGTAPLLTLGAVAGLLVWAYWPALTALAGKWSTDPQYSHGFLVIPFALFLLWTWRHELPAPLPVPSAWGVALLALGAVLRLAGARFYFEWFEYVSLLPSLAGLVLLLGGWPLLRWAWPALAFLLFMFPLPYRLEHALTGTLQRTAASS